jgi:hypothetical protein
MKTSVAMSALFLLNHTRTFEQPYCLGVVFGPSLIRPPQDDFSTMSHLSLYRYFWGYAWVT